MSSILEPMYSIYSIIGNFPQIAAASHRKRIKSTLLQSEKLTCVDDLWT